VAKKYDLVLLVSGPEPQRAIFEELLVKTFDSSSFSFALVRGLPEGATDLRIKNSKGKVFDHLPADALNTLICEADTVIARSGYSTIMDLVKVQQKAILIPTPGQTEQEYLAAYVLKKNMFTSMSQSEFSLDKVIETIRECEPEFTTPTNAADDTIAHLLRGIKMLSLQQ
jgi:UDP-N-acetylglucosamine transferase subunit ALG13